MTDTYQIDEGPVGLPRYGASKQEKGEWEVRTEPALHGIYHAHYLDLKGRWQWALRRRRSELCKTPRCRLIAIEEV